MSVNSESHGHVASTSSRLLAPDALRALELHEARAHAHGRRTVRDLGDAILLHDPVDRDPFMNRLSGLRLPSEDPAATRRLTELLSLFVALDRRPHVWLSPRFHSPDDLGTRLEADGFVDLGGTYTMVLDDVAATTRVAVPDGARIERTATAGARAPSVLEGAARVFGEAFGADADGVTQIADDLARTTVGAWDVCLVSVDDEPVAAGRRYTADGMTYLSSIATRPSRWGRGFGAVVTATLARDGRRAGGRIVHLGVEPQNARAQRLYRRLGFTILGDRIADLLL